MLVTKITPDTEIMELAKGLSRVHYEGNYDFDDFLNQGVHLQMSRM